jgi:hypothetical protein
VATAAILKFLSLRIMCTHVRQNFWEVSSNSKHHSKPTMNINSQHHNLLGNQISPKSEDFCIWRPFCTLVTMATAAILKFFQPTKAATHYGGYSYKVSWSLMKGIQKCFESPLFCFHGNCGKVCSTDSVFLAYLVPLDMDVVPIKFHQFLFGE